MEIEHHMRMMLAILVRLHGGRPVLDAPLAYAPHHEIVEVGPGPQNCALVSIEALVGKEDCSCPYSESALIRRRLWGSNGKHNCRRRGPVSHPAR